MTDYRAELQRLVEKIEYTWGDIPEDVLELIDSIRTALAQPEPEGAGLSDDTIEADFRSWYNDRYHHHYFGVIPLVECIEWTREALARYTLAQPEPEGVADEEIEREALKNADSDDEYRAFKSGAFFVQEHISRPAIEPVPVAERLPELRGMFERILCVARTSGGPLVGNIQLADQLLDAVVGWAGDALPVPGAEVAPPNYLEANQVGHV
jgi:hypothetical protein